jgi:hypothetical protein
MSRYWVGTTGNWSDTANWSDSSGGAGGFSVPTASDDVVFDASSGTGTATVDSAAFCDDLNFTGFTGTFAGTAALSIYGSLTLDGAMTRTFTGAINFLATATGKTITLDGETTASFVTFDGSGGGWTVQDTWSNSSSTIRLDRGTLDTNDQIITCSSFIVGSSSSTRALDLGTSTVNCSSWNASNTSNLTFTAGTSTIAVAGSSSGTTFAGGSQTYATVTFTSTTSSSFTLSGTNTFGTLTVTGPTNKTQQVLLSGNQTISGTLTIAGNSLTNRLWVRSDTLGTARTITAAVTTLSNVDFQDITGAGAGTWSGTSIGNALGCSGITFTATVTRYGVVAGSWSDTATWSTSSGGAGGASVPLCHDAVVLDSSSAAGTYSADMPRACANLTCTGFTRTLTTTAADLYLFGNVTLGSGMTMTNGSNTYQLMGRGSHTITTAGKTFGADGDTEIRAFGGTYTMQDAWTVEQDLEFFNGTFDANDFDVTADTFVNASSLTKTISMGSGTWTATGTGTVWSFSVTANTTVNVETANIVLSNASTTSKTFAGGSRTYNTVTLTGAGICSYTFTGSNTFTTLASTKTVAHSLVFTTGTTQTVTNWSIVGTAGNVVTINSTTTGTHTLTKSGGGRITSDYLDIQHSIATPSDTWYAGLNSTNNQAVATAGSGWLFTVPLPTVTTSAASSITDVTATGNGNVTDNGEGTITRRGFAVATSAQSDPGNTDPDASSYTLVFDEEGTFSEGAFNLALTGLTEQTTYYVRAFCENEAGFDYGAEVSFTTEATPLAPVVTTGVSDTITGTGAAVYGNLVSENGSDVTRKGFVGSTTSHSNPSNTAPEDTDYELVEDESGSFSVGAFNNSFSGLTVNTTYYYRAFAENAVGFAYGDEATLTTDSLPAVTTNPATDRESTTATLNGTITSDGNSTLLKRGFVYDTQSRSNPGNTATSGYANTVEQTTSLTTGAFEADITSLSASTLYYVRAFAQNGVGYTYGDESTFLTDVFPGTTNISNASVTSVTLSNQNPSAVTLTNQTGASATLTNL